MAWHSGALILIHSLLYLMFHKNSFCFCFFVHPASLGQDVRCWWNRGISVSRNVSIECHAEPPRFPQKCDRCQLRLSAAENSTLAVPHRCTHNAANFTALLSPQALQNISCELLCGQANKTCAIQEGCDHFKSFHYFQCLSLYNPLEEPLSPLITNHTCDPFEIFWSVEDDVNEASSQQRICEVQYMNECDMDWTEVEGTYDLSFTLDHPVPFLTYMFRVRCGFLGERIIMSNWSLYTTRTPAGGKQLQSMCINSLRHSSVLWKQIVVPELPNIETSLTTVLQLVYSPFEISVLECLGYLAKPEILLNVTGGSQFLNVSWSVPSQSIEHIQEYVVQYKPVGLPCTHSQNWVKVNITQNWVTLRGQFWKYTAYNVSLLAVINKCMHLVQSATVYTVQEVPPKVTDIRVTDISASSAILTWKPLPLDNSQRVILNYLVAVSNHTVLNVSSDKNSILLTELNPGQQYKVWISAVTSGGQGEKTTTLFATRSATDISGMV
uniref:Fibronectin type-III domain-containing protein n=1 Tax=Pygocentrus nattereri TaxID=42514 RepID=A0AAR2JU24_PYGNA